MKLLFILGIFIATIYGIACLQPAPKYEDYCNNRIGDKFIPCDCSKEISGSEAEQRCISDQQYYGSFTSLNHK